MYMHGSEGRRGLDRIASPSRENTPRAEVMGLRLILGEGGGGVLGSKTNH